VVADLSEAFFMLVPCLGELVWEGLLTALVGSF